jgi:hypothetical protein
VIQENKLNALDTIIQGKVMNEAGQALSGISVKITSPDDPNFEQKSYPTDEGRYNTPTPTAQPDTITSALNYDMQVSFLNLEAAAKLRDIEPNRKLEVDLTFNVLGLDPDKAFADSVKLDVTKPFYPFGQQPQPGAAFYFSQEEVFSKPGAQVQIYVARTMSPLDAFDITTPEVSIPSVAVPVQPQTKKPLSHLIAWEYWNGQRWVTMFQSSAIEPARDLDTTEIVELTVRPDMTRTKVNDQDGLWMRARLVSGGFGFKQDVTFNTNKLTYVINQPPALAAFRIGYTWRDGPFHPEQVRTYNDFQYEDHTYEAIWPGVTFFPFTYVRDVTPAFYLGFDKKLPVDGSTTLNRGE